MTATDSLGSALAGLRVVDLSHVIAGPTVSHYLALHGADVIKVEKPDGDSLRYSGTHRVAEGVSVAFAAINAGKRSLAIDLKRPRLKAALLRLVDGADLFIENFRPGVIDRLGLGYEALKARNPRLVYASISGFGQHGPWRTRGAYDHVVQAVSGMAMAGGAAGNAPTKVGFPVIDTATGMVGAQAVLVALLQRERTGEGCWLDISMVQASLQLMLPQVVRAMAQGHDMPRVGNRGFSGSPGATTFECRDGWLAVGANTPAQFRTLCALVGREAIPADSQLIDQEALRSERGFVRAVDREAVNAILAEALRSRSAAEMEQQLNDAGVPSARVRTMTEFVHDAVKAHAVELATAGIPGSSAGTSPGHVFGPGYRVMGTSECATAAAAPVLGSHTAALLVEAGLTRDEIEDFAAQGALCAADLAGAATPA